MKPVITFFETDLSDKDALLNELQTLGKPKEVKGIIEYTPRNKKTAEVVRILREHGVEYQITFTAV